MATNPANPANPATAATPRASVRKAVIPAGGFGTRFLPAAKAVPKELLPILGRPVIDYVVAEAIDAGCTEVCIVLRHGKESIQRLFEPAPDLESRLSHPARSKDLELVQRPGRGANICYVYQPAAAGLGDAVLQARLFAGDDPFLVLAGDTIIEPTVAPHLVAAYERSGGSAVAVEHVPDELVSRYGIVSPTTPTAPIAADDTSVQAEPFHINHLIEKPAPEESPSNYAISARYLFTSAIWPLLAATGPGRGGEIQLTDAMDHLAREDHPGGGMMAVPIPGKRYDLGNPIDFLAAEVEFARKQLSPEELLRVGL